MYNILYTYTKIFLLYLITMSYIPFFEQVSLKLCLIIWLVEILMLKMICSYSFIRFYFYFTYYYCYYYYYPAFNLNKLLKKCMRQLLEKFTILFYYNS